MIKVKRIFLQILQIGKRDALMQIFASVLFASTKFHIAIQLFFHKPLPFFFLLSYVIVYWVKKFPLKRISILGMYKMQNERLFEIFVTF